MIEINLLKGGSLSRTYHLLQSNLVCKEVSTQQEREYGFMRWYSQTKKMIRFSGSYPDLFPKIYQISSNDEIAEVKMEWLTGYKDIKTILVEDVLTRNEISKINDALWTALNIIHSRTYNFIPGLGSLYYYEEVLKKLTDANLASTEFCEFAQQDMFKYHGKTVHNIYAFLKKLEKFFIELELTEENDILGNPTLENVMYSFQENKVKFIDLYEESVVDTKFLDYSMIMQCSRSHYGYVNDNDVKVEGNSVSHDLQMPKNFEIFNHYFESNISDLKIKNIVNVFEATQFIRMLPFKVKAGEINKAKYFYVHACHLLNRIFK